MAGFIPKRKLSKKAAKELAKQSRTVWEISPVTRKAESKKTYNRKRNFRDRYDDSGAEVFRTGRIPARLAKGNAL